jgi:hypothetical protein
VNSASCKLPSRPQISLQTSLSSASCKFFLRSNTSFHKKFQTFLGADHRFLPNFQTFSNFSNFSWSWRTF